MRITVFGANGKIGRLVVEQLLANGHHVTAFVRDPAKLRPFAGERLTIIQGGLSDESRIEAAVAGADAVISALGPSLRRGTQGTPVADGTRAIVAAQRKAGVRRHVGLATPSVADPRDQPTLKAKILPVMARVLFPNALAELVGMTNAVTTSDLDWTIARITNPTDRPARGTVRSVFLGRAKVGSSIARADIAAFLVAQLTDTGYLRAAPAISN
jgi:putative NADH-flavin reductase